MTCYLARRARLELVVARAAGVSAGSSFRRRWPAPSSSARWATTAYNPMSAKFARTLQTHGGGTVRLRTRRRIQDAAGFWLKQNQQ